MTPLTPLSPLETLYESAFRAGVPPVGNPCERQTPGKPSVSVLCIYHEGDHTMTNPFRELEALGQSLWLDDIDRKYVRSGLFEQLINEEGLTGATGNPTIFEHAIDHGTAYAEQMRRLIAQGLCLCATGRRCARTRAPPRSRCQRSCSRRCVGQQPRARTSTRSSSFPGSKREHPMSRNDKSARKPLTMRREERKTDEM